MICKIFFYKLKGFAEVVEDNFIVEAGVDWFGEELEDDETVIADFGESVQIFFKRQFAAAGDHMAIFD